MSEYIEREDLLRYLNDIWMTATPTDLMPDDDRQLAMVRCMGLNDAMDAVKSLPAADVRPVVRGKWIDRDDDYYGWNMWACSACGEEFVLTEGTPNMNDYHFCPNCGARMEES